MKTISKTLSSILLAATIVTSSVQLTKMASITASAAYTNDLSITGYESFYLTSGEYTDIEYRFSGEGIAAVRLKTSSNLSAFTKNVRWVEYPGSCQAFYSIKSLDGNDGTMQFSLLDDDGHEAMSFRTQVIIETETEDEVVTPAPCVYFEDLYFPAFLEVGQGNHISGTISSTDLIDSIQAVVYNSDSDAILTANCCPNSTSYSLRNSDLDWGLSFGQLLPGDYTLTYFVASGSTDRSYTHNFTVKAEEAAVPVISFENMSFPTSFEEGCDPIMKGSISSTQNVDSISIEVCDSYGNVVLSTYNNLSWWNITLKDSSMNTEIDFSKLDPGDYTINYYASSGLGNNTYTQYFTVYSAYKPDPVITFSSMSFPKSIPQGNGQHISGMISSTYDIDAIQAVVTDSSGKVWLNAKRHPDQQNTYSLFNSSLDWDLSFSELPAGDYKLTYFVASGATDRSYVHSFSVKAKELPAPKITFSEMEFPENLDVNKGQHIKGTVSSSDSISKIRAVVKDSDGKSVISVTKYPNAKSYSLYDSDLDWALPFSSLSAGDYTLTYTAVSGKATESYTHKFSVGKKSTNKLDLSKGLKYCAKWWNDRNSEIWPNSGSDCSNFASQFLWAAGLKTDSKFKPGSRTVLGFDNLKKYLYEKYGVNTIMRKHYSDCLAVEEGFAKYKSKLSYKDIAPGDLVVMPGYDSNGNKINDGHIMIVYKVSGSKIYCYGHSNNRNGKKYYISDSYVQGVVKTSVLFE